jgi:hypothetical protein
MEWQANAYQSQPQPLAKQDKGEQAESQSPFTDITLIIGRKNKPMDFLQMATKAKAKEKLFLTACTSNKHFVFVPLS